MNVYCHVPFCRSKCGYCAFYSEPDAPDSLRKKYLDKLESDLARADWDGMEVETLYLGGGTPSILTVPELERLFGMLRRLPLGTETEISMECNPETLDEEKIALIRTFVTRLSCGVQSFEPRFRRTLGRDCSQEALDRALAGIVAARFSHFNIDLMYAIPGQSLADWGRELDCALACGADHFSCYALTPEEGTRLAGTTVDDDLAADMYDLAGMRLLRYEISNYASPGGECHHNLNVWCGGLLRGFGPAAASFEGGIRRIEPESLERWLQNVPPEIDEIPLEARFREILAVNLRTVRGWTPAMWGAIPLPHGAYNWDWVQKIAHESAAEFLHITPERIALRPEALPFWNSAAEALL